MQSPSCISLDNALESKNKQGSQHVIGVVGGMGPTAGVELTRVIYEQSLACCDAEHPSVLLYSLPSRIPDRTDYVLHKKNINPAIPVVDVVRALSLAGATHIGIPCNTFHSPMILECYNRLVSVQNLEVKFVDIIDETCRRLVDRYPMARQVSVLGTLGTVRSEIYKEPLSLHGTTLIEMEEERQERVHDLIYNPRWGLKSRPWVDPFVRRELKSTILYLKEIGAQAIILGCTELRFALGEKSFEELPIVDSVTALARALLRETAFEQLRPD